METDLHSVSLRDVDLRDSSMLSLPKPFPSKAVDFASTVVPDTEEWHLLQHYWDIITDPMIPTYALHDKSIHLRNPFLFYIGHIPAQWDILLSKASFGLVTSDRSYFGKITTDQRAYFHKIFERGIDPVVKDSKKVHDHSYYPEDNPPPLENVLTYQTQVRDELEAFLKIDSGRQRIGRALCLAFEHEGRLSWP